MSDISPNTARAFIIDDDDAVRDAMSLLLSTADIPHTLFTSANEFLSAYDDALRGCLVVDIRMPGISGLELQDKLRRRNCHLQIIFMTGHGDVPMAVEAMRKGAMDFLRKPIQEDQLLERIVEAFEQESTQHETLQNLTDARARVASLTEREQQVFQCVAQGLANKVIAMELDISERTVEVHRSQVMKKLAANTLADLVRIHVITQ